MANISRITQVLEEIKKTLHRRRPRIFSAQQLRQIFEKNKKKWNLPAAMNLKKFVAALEQEVVIDQYQLSFEAEEFKGYYLCSSSANYIISSIVPKTFLSHASALNVWGLTQQDNRIYINRELFPASAKSTKGTLVQTAIDSVFSRPQRQPAVSAEFNGIDVALIHGKFTGQLGVTEITLKNREQILVTDMERTLIDCVVRPTYALPPGEMIAIFKKAKPSVSIPVLAAYLEELNYTYPYHQCIGFYLERAQNYSAAEIEFFSSQEIKYNFYLTYELISPAYDKRWKIYYPALLDKGI
jgi:predicted transcriptional regulator of viral defense system